MKQPPNPKQVAAIKAKQSDSQSDEDLENQVKSQGGKAGVILKAVAKKANNPKPKKPKKPAAPPPEPDADGDFDGDAS